MRANSTFLFYLAALIGSSAAAQTCSLAPGAIGLGNYCHEAMRLKQKDSAQTQSSADQQKTAPTNTYQQDASAASVMVTPIYLKDSQFPGSATQTPPPSFKLEAGSTVRATLNAWTRQAGWTFLPEHYTIGVDIPISASSENIGGDFRASVRTLLDSTALTDTPIQPCFYSNNVLRVVLRTDRCDRL